MLSERRGWGKRDVASDMGEKSWVFIFPVVWKRDFAGGVGEKSWVFISPVVSARRAVCLLPSVVSEKT
jgi:hypothetical protein